MRKQEEIIEVCGKKVVVRYARTQEDACASCAFSSCKECHDLDCNMRDIVGESVCKYAYFVEAEQQVPAYVQEAANKYIGHPYEVAEGVEVSMRRDAYAAGMRDERERLASCPTIKGWVARDGHGALVFSNEKPSRLEWCGWKLWKISRDTPAVVLPNSILSDLRWEDEPKPVRVIIEEIK